MNAAECFQAGRLDDAIAAAVATVKAQPQDVSARSLLAELLSLAGELDRADKQLNALPNGEPPVMMAISLFRHLIRAEQARQQFFSDGRVPEFLERPSPEMQLRLEAAVNLRAGDPAAALALLAQADATQPIVSGTCDGTPFSGLRDLDDVTASCLELLTANGKYYWIEWSQIERIEFRPPRRPRDLLWRSARLALRNGPESEAHVPVLYAGSKDSSDPQIRLGRATDWLGGEGEPVRGLGQRTLLVGEEAKTLLEITVLEIAAPPTA